MNQVLFELGRGEVIYDKPMVDDTAQDQPVDTTRGSCILNTSTREAAMRWLMTAGGDKTWDLCPDKYSNEDVFKLGRAATRE